MRNLHLQISLLLLTFLFSIGWLKAQSTYYIDPTQNPGSGTELSPFNSFSQVNWTSGDIYLVARGTTMNLSSPLTIPGSNISIGAYGSGLSPVIICSSASMVIEISNVSGTTIKDIALSGNNSSITDIGVKISGTSSSYVSSTLISNCIINNVEKGVYTDYVNFLTISDCDIETSLINIDLNHGDEIIIERDDLHLVYNSSVVGEKYCIKAYSCYKFDIRNNTLISDEPIECHLFYSELVLGGLSRFYNNYCIGSKFTVSCAKLGTSETVLYNNWLTGAKNGILGTIGSTIACTIHHNIVFNCIENGIYFPSTSYSPSNFIANIRHNVIYNNSGLSSYSALNCGPIFGFFSDIWFENNVVFQTAGKVYLFHNLNSMTSIDNNRIPLEFPDYIEYNGVNFSTLASWKQTGGYIFDLLTFAYEANSSSPGSIPFVSSNPTTWADFTPSPESNLIDAGKVLSNPAHTNYKLDYYGHYIPSGIPPTGMTGVDIGAIEYYEPENIDFVTNSPSGWYYATKDIVDADYENKNFMHKMGNIYHDGELSYLRGVNLPGTIGVDALQLNQYGIDDILQSIKKQGYNSIRLNYPVDVILNEINNTSQPIQQYYVNENLPGNDIFYSASGIVKSEFEGLEALINKCNDPDIGLNVVLSHHGLETPTNCAEPGFWEVFCSSTYIISLDDYLKSLFYAAEKFYQNNIVGISLINEPFAAKWDGTDEEKDFRRFVQTASFNIRAINPDWMIFVEGLNDTESDETVEQEASLFSYNSTYLGTVNDPSESYGNAENLSTYGYDQNYPNKPNYPINEIELPYHKLVFSPHTTQFEEYYVMDNIMNNQDYIKDVNDFKWGYLADNHAVIPGEFGAFYQSENPGINFVPQAQYAEEWFKFYINYIAEKKLPGSFYWAYNGNNDDRVIDNQSVEYCYNQSIVSQNDWTFELGDKAKDYAIMFGRVDMTITDPLIENTMYSPRDGTAYSFPANSLANGYIIKHTAHWAGEDYLTSSSPDYVEYASDIIAAKANLEYKASILHEFKIVCFDPNGNPVSTSTSDFTISVNYTDNELGNVHEQYLGFYKYDPQASAWVIANGTASFDSNENLAILITDEFGIYAVLGLGYEVTQTISLTYDWSLISTYVEPNHPYLPDMFNGISIVILKNTAGQVYWPNYNQNQIGSWNYLEGYTIKMASPSSIDVEGLWLYPETIEVNIPSGWSYIPYLRSIPGAIAVMVQDLNMPAQYDLIKNSAGQLYWPSSNVNDIGMMYPGEGYQIKLNSPDVLIYPSNNAGSTKETIIHNEELLFKNYTQDLVRNTDNNMVIGIPLNAWPTTPQNGDEIAALGERGQLVGKTIFKGGFTAFIIYGDDLYTTDVIENLVVGEAFTIEVWSLELKTFKQYKFKAWERGNGSFEKNGIDIVKIEKPGISEIITKFYIYPNPTDGMFQLKIISDNDVSALIQISDTHGKTVYANQLNFNKGSQVFEINLTNLKAGTYFLNLSNNSGFNKTEELIIQ